MNLFRIIAFSISFLLMMLNEGEAARRVIQGCVADSATSVYIEKATVRSADKRKGTVTDRNGNFSLRMSEKQNRLIVSALGYEQKEIWLDTVDSNRVNVFLSPKEFELEELVVKPRKDKYSKKNNPAVELMKQLREDGKRVSPLNSPYYSYDKYEKIVLGLNNFTRTLAKGKHTGKVAFLNECIDTALWTGKRVLNLSVKENFSTRICSTSPDVDKEIVKASRSVGIDDSFNADNIRKALQDVLREVDIFGNDITLMQNRFVSPLSKIGPDYYKYFITDTVPVGDIPCIELSFSPKTPESFGFNGKIFIARNDSCFYPKRVSMRVPKAINLNYINNIFISQNFSIDSIGKLHKTSDDISLELQIIPGTPEFYASRTTRYNNFSFLRNNSLDEFYSRLGNIFQIDESDNIPESSWDQLRLVPLSKAEDAVAGIAGKARKIPLLYWGEKLVEIVAKGYVATGKRSRFDFGPVNTFISYNSVEGMRFRLGGITTANLSPHLFARGYVAYGLRDHRFKYGAELEYSFPKKNYHSREFPVNGIRLTHSYDIDQIGQHYLFTNPDNIFLSLKRKESILSSYRRFTKLEYNLELRNNLSFGLSAKHEIQYATPWVVFRNGLGENIPHYSQSTLLFSVRYAPGEKFVQGVTTRQPINMDAWTILLTHEFGPKGMFNSDFTLNKTELSVSKRFWLSAFGYIDLLAKGGMIWSSVQYPALLWPNANLSYTIQPESYSLMNPMEFANDKYASLDFTYWLNGALFNRIPLLKKLKLREIITFKALYGGLSRKNNPEYNPDLFRFPETAIASTMGKTPYMEAGVGIDNIFTILRIDYIWRLTYRHTPATDRSGLRISLHFSF